MRDIVKKIFVLFDKRQSVLLLLIVGLMLFGAILETLGVSLIIPLITLMLDQDFYKTNQYAHWFCRLFHINSSKTFMLIIIFGMVFVFVFKNVFLFLEYYIQQNFVRRNRVRIQSKVLNSIIERKYEYFLSESTSNVMRIVVDDITGTFTVLEASLNLLTEGIICVAFFLMVMKTNMLMACSVSIVLLCEVLGIDKCIKPKMNNMGVTSRQVGTETKKWIIQLVSGVKEIKVTDGASFFLHSYEKNAKEDARIRRNSYLLSSMPRLIIESVTISFMLLFLAILLVNNVAIEKLFPQLSAFAVAAVKILPSVNRISTARNQISFFEPSLNALVDNLQFIDRYEAGTEKEKKRERCFPEITLNNYCELRHISYCYPNSDRRILDDASMKITVGSSVGLVGTSGGGKTTTVDILLGLLTPQTGEVMADGQNIENNYSGWLRHISYIPQMIFLLDDTICSNVAFGIPESEIDEEMVWRAIEEACLKEFVLSLPEGIYTTIGERGIRLSGGQRQRVGIARALYSAPELLIFDEATSALDYETEAAIMESINELHGKKTLIIIAHRLTTIEACDVVYRVGEGKIIQEK